MMDEKRQIGIMTGVALLVIAGIMFFVSYSSPNVYKEDWQSKVAENSTTQSTEISSKKISFPLNLNEASAEDLMNIEGVGESRANAIIAYRNEIGSYTSVEQIKNIEGIGNSLYEKIAPYLTV